MKRRIRKYILFTSMLAMTIMCLTSTTYAFVLLNNTVEIQEFQLNIDTDEGLLISVDGVRYYNAISLNELETTLGQSLSTINLAPAAMKQDGNKKIVYNEVDDANINMPQTHNIVMQKDSIVYGNTLGYQSVFDSNHQFVDAVANQDYLTFDVYFKLDGSFETADGHSYGVQLSKDSFMRNHNTTIPETQLQNDLTAYVGGVSVDAGVMSYVDGSAKNYGTTPTTNEHPVESDKITVDAANALRMAFVHKPGENNKVFIVEHDNEKSLGSAAVEGRTAADPRHFKDYNAMYTYYNNLWKPAFTSAAVDGEAYDDSNYINLNANTTLAQFKKSTVSNVTSYDVVKMTVVIWLEGWDADYFLDIEHGVSQFDIRLKFDLLHEEPQQP